MKTIYVSQRVDIIADYNERRDALDQRWTDFLLKTGAIAFPMPNNIRNLRFAIGSNPPDGILLTGGNSPEAYGGNAPERDDIDKVLLNYAAEHKIPLIGVCRGLQSVLTHFGGTLQVVSSHVAVRHNVNGRINKEVNSYHNLAAKTVPDCFNIFAISDDGTAEAFSHKTLPILALMWHPEREEAFCKHDIKLFIETWERN